MKYILFTILIILLLYYSLTLKEDFLILKEDFSNTKQNDKEIILITQFYIPKDNKRKQEIITCLEKNLNNKYIREIHLFVEKKYKLKSILKNNKNFNKIKLILENDRLSFKRAFNYSNDNIVSDSKNKIIILANSDIFFDNTIKNLYTYNLNQTFLALSRIDAIDRNNNFKYQKAFSQDTWIWYNKINVTKNNDQYNDDGIILGFAGCDNTISYILDKSGYKVENKCKLINTFHLHENDFREWTNKKRYLKYYKTVACE